MRSFDGVLSADIDEMAHPKSGRGPADSIRWSTSRAQSERRGATADRLYTTERSGRSNRPIPKGGPQGVTSAKNHETLDGRQL